MKKRLMFCVFFILFQLVYSFQTSTESINPFNEFMSPSGGVNLYSGDVAYTYPLVTVKGRGGMDINLALAYSSNIYSQVHCGNDRAPTGWAGLGWRMGFGSILRNHKGTKRFADDEFIWISPAGVPSRIVKNGGLKCKIYEGTWTSLPDFSTLPVVDSCITSAIAPQGLKKANYGLVFEGGLLLGDGTYTFTLTSDDGSKLYIDNNLIVSNDDIHTCSPESETVTINGTLHPIRIEYFQGSGKMCLKLEYSQNGDPPQEFTGDQLIPMLNETEWAWDFDRYYIENDPFTRIEPVLDATNNIIRWVVTATDGKKMYYGDAGLASTDSSTRYTFAFGDYVGTGWGSQPELFPYQWDLNSIVDITGNTLQFKYHQEKQAVVVDTWNSAELTPPLYFTKASYLKSIYTPEGKHVDFENESKWDEPFDPYKFFVEPDGFIELFESERLKTIKIYSIPGSASETGRIDFNYNLFYKTGLAAKYKKYYLTHITHENNGLTGASTRFEYNTDFDATDVNYNAGALHRIIDEKTSLVTEFTYTKQTIPSVKTSDKAFDGHTRRGTYCGITGDGNPYVVSRGGGDTPRWIEIFNWTGCKWELKFPWYEMGKPGFNVDVFALKDHIVLRGEGDEYIEILTWDGKRWYISQSYKDFSDPDYDDQVLVIPGMDYIAFLSGQYQNELQIFHWRNNHWVETFNKQQVGVAADKSVDIYPNGSHIAIASGGKRQYIDIYTFNGEAWVKTLDSTGPFELTYSLEMYPGNNFYALRLGDDDVLEIISWNGTQWQNTFTRKDISMSGENIDMRGFNDHLLLRHNNNDYLHIISWNGEKWDTTFTRSKIADEGADFDFDEIGPDYLSLRHGSDNNKMEILSWNPLSKMWDDKFLKQSVGIAGYNVEFYPGPDYIALRIFNDDFLQVYRYDGTAWTSAFVSVPISGDEFKVSAVGPAFAVQGGSDVLKLYYKFQDNFNTSITSFAVTQKKVTDPLARGGTALTTTYDYNLATNANYDTRAGTAKFNKVDITTTGAGKISQYFFNDVEIQATFHPQYDELDGMVYKTENVDGSGTIIDSSKNTYEVFKKPYWPQIVKQKRVVTSVSWRQGVESRNDLLNFNQWNGLPEIARTVNSDGTQKITKTRFAFQNPKYIALMSGQLDVGAYMLTVPCQTETYEQAAGVTTPPAVTELRSAQAIRYSNTLGCNAMLPYKTYAWKSDFNPDGTPKETFANFNHFSPDASNPNWQLTSSIDLYNSSGGAIQTSDARGMSSTVILTNDNTLPLMNVSNAQYGSCIFTNWTENQPFYVNDAIMAMSTDPVDLHFSGRTMKLSTDTCNPAANQYVVAAATSVNDNLPVLGGKAFAVQFWAKGDCDLKTFLSLHTQPGSIWLDSKEFDVTTLWKKYELTMTFPFGVTDKQYRLLLRPPHSGSTYTAGTVLFDDVRVTPAGALSTVNYYDPVWRKPSLSLDANNNPGAKVTLDGLSRPVSLEKLDPTKSVGETGYATVFQRKKYHFRSDLPDEAHIQLLSPDGGEIITNASSLVIRWVSDGSSEIAGLSYRLKTSGVWNGIGTVPNQSGVCSFEWRLEPDGTMPSGLADEYIIKVQVGTNPDEIDSSDAPFYLSTP